MLYFSNVVVHVLQKIKKNKKRERERKKEKKDKYLNEIPVKFYDKNVLH